MDVSQLCGRLQAFRPVGQRKGAWRVAVVQSSLRSALLFNWVVWNCKKVSRPTGRSDRFGMTVRRRRPDDGGLAVQNSGMCRISRCYLDVPPGIPPLEKRHWSSFGTTRVCRSPDPFPAGLSTPTHSRRRWSRRILLDRPPALQRLPSPFLLCPSDSARPSLPLNLSPLPVVHAPWVTMRLGRGRRTASPSRRVR